MTFVAEVGTARVSLPVARDLVVYGAAGVHDKSNFLLVRIRTDDGVTGYGEVSATPKWSGEDASSADHFIRSYLAPVIMGESLMNVAHLEGLMDSVLSGNEFTKAGVSIALWDAYARVLGIPLAAALGGIRRQVVPIKCSLSGASEQIRRSYEAASSRGFTAFKVKVGFDLKDDLARVRLARGLIGDSFVIGTDANGGWSEATARNAIPELMDLGVSFLEQPVPLYALKEMTALRRLGIPIVADESVGTMLDLTRVITADAADVVSIYVGMAGGPGRAVAAATVACAFGLELVIGSNGEMGIGAAAQLHVACAAPALSTTIPSDIIGSSFYDRDILEVPICSTGTAVHLGLEPGLGVVPAEDILFDIVN